MKGIVFNMFGEMIEEKFGIEVWDSLIERTAPPSEGVYTSTEVYPDEELFGFVGCLSESTGVPVQDLVAAFGEYSLFEFASRYPEFFEGVDAKALLKSVDEVIHVEVKKLHPDAQLPGFTYEDPAPDELVMKYRSPRKLCSFAEGLIEGTAKHYGVSIERRHATCMHRGDDHCRLELRFGAGSGGHA